MPIFVYRLIDSTGSDLGPLVSSTDSPVGGLIKWHDGYMRITAVVAPETEETFRAYLVVEPIEIVA